MCTGGFASAVHVKFITTLVHTLLVVFVVKMTFSGPSAKQKHNDFSFETDSLHSCFCTCIQMARMHTAMGISMFT